MGKRKQNIPQYADDAKRRHIQWSMGDQPGPSGAASIIDNTTQSKPEESHLLGAKSSTSQTSTSPSSTSAFAVHVDAFYQNLAACSCTLTLNSPDSHRAKDKSNLLEFGRFKITFLEHQDTMPLPAQLPVFTECWLYLSTEDAPNMLYFEFEEKEEKLDAKKRRKSSSRQTEFGIFWFVKLNVPTPLLTDLGNKSFWLGCDSFNSSEKILDVTVYGHKSLILQVSHPSEPVRLKAPQLATQKLMEYFFNIQLPYCPKEGERTTGHDFFELYERVMEIHRSRLSEDQEWEGEVLQVIHPCLKPRLRPYQRESVAWMLRQEQKSAAGGEKLHPLYCQITLPRNISLYYNRYAGSFIQTWPQAFPPLPGGILADEMGLGKTVEVLCCMLLHPRSEVDCPEELPVLEESALPFEDAQVTWNGEELSQVPTEVNLSADSGAHQNNATRDGEIPSTSSATPADFSQSEEQRTKLSAQTIDKIGEVGNESSPSQTTASENSTADLADHGTKHNIVEQENSPVKTVLKKEEREESPTSKLPSLSQLNSGSNPFLSDTALFQAEKNVTAPCPPLSQGVQDSTDTNSSPALSSGQLQACMTLPNQISLTDQPEEPSNNVDKKIDAVNKSNKDNFSIENSNLDNEVTNSKILENADAGLAGQTLPGPSSSEAGGSTPSSHGKLPDSGSSNKKGRKRKSRGYVEYVPVESDADSGSNYFSIQPAQRQQWFECSCGHLESMGAETRGNTDLHTVKCIECGMSQHAECMNYDLRDPFRGAYLCPHCHAICTTIKSGATLIISPYSICHQWIEEIRKHIKERSIKVFIYTGVSKLGYIQPQVLARQDIVITTYDVLRKELDYANLPHTNSESGRRFRHPKRFLATPSPMVAVEWWRICLDEAQMVECVTTKTAEMALRLKAVNRWCVTGTPLMRSVEDIYGLLLFLNVDPLRVQQWFRQLVWEPFCHGLQAPMHHALAQVFWRTAKKDVIDQIDLPMQTEEINWLTFSPVEDHFYRRQYEVYLRSVYGYRQKVQHLQDPSVKLHALDRKTMNELMSPLFRLRQACCHPQIVRGEFLPLNKAMMTMEELLEHMTKKVKTECEEAHRLIVASLNGMAGLAIIKDKIPEAVEKYREVLRSVEQNKDQFRTDDLQQLHAMHNLALLLDTKPEGVAPTLRDSQLKQQCEELKTKYMARTKTNVSASLDGLESSQKTIKDLKMKLDSLDGDWWAEVVDMATQRSIDSDLVFKVKDDLVRTSTTEGTIADTFSTALGLLYVVDQHLQTLTSARVALTDRLDQLWRDTSSTLVQAAATCCLRPADQVLKTCLFCKVDELFNEYESKLFLFVERCCSGFKHREPEFSLKESELTDCLKKAVTLSIA
ncbi:E3 ubiquitin-protein ligase shprh [Plakobranchus ocellatus]|uniref:E3 ubiquitin-protein ligase shprh n=1 Tax=Plakobranchus ocellatus TaxID=259542 RepID=A0AAV3XZ29_9GAST|nr:E3 ubiquitin-protein ligase shprh [Plakobranchus ocellatus]